MYDGDGHRQRERTGGAERQMSHVVERQLDLVHVGVVELMVSPARQLPVKLQRNSTQPPYQLLNTPASRVTVTAGDDLPRFSCKRGH